MHAGGLDGHHYAHPTTRAEAPSHQPSGLIWLNDDGDGDDKYDYADDDDESYDGEFLRRG